MYPFFDAETGLGYDYKLCVKTPEEALLRLKKTNLNLCLTKSVRSVGDLLEKRMKFLSLHLHIRWLWRKPLS